MASADLLPKHPTFNNFTQGWNALSGYSFTHFYLNTFGLIAGVLFTTIVSNSLVAFGFARISFPLRNF
ncbi:hypothetical protein MUG84_26825 [Paenibacillus sp. KQZ6P-2]|uniref:Uncharacterized protein n=1 Tax=Paenibacillus mangrovi TaxID=2931978 RepID=A0A9X2B5R2_9BACL|nr:hypothetical protein [Paenibacillus mangrovi]MCJ8015285.1 hypothetical protein [Paenibacillus mangrovi]